jgi:uncharacterized protein with PIN domain
MIPYANERALRALLCRVRDQSLQAGVERLLAVARHFITYNGGAADTYLVDLYRRERRRILRRLLRRRRPGTEKSRRRLEAFFEFHLPELPPLDAPDFHCDAALGGMARWLRAAGYDVAFWPGIDDDDLLRQVHSRPAILLTTDTRLMDRSVIRWGAIAARLISNRLTKCEQFVDLIGRLQLPVRPPRCMACGGELATVEKQTVKDRIPPKTFPWLDEYFVCRRCDRLFWKGTHWRRIETVLSSALP